MQNGCKLNYQCEAVKANPFIRFIMFFYKGKAVGEVADALENLRALAEGGGAAEE